MLTDSSPFSKTVDIETMLVNAIAAEHEFRQRKIDLRIIEWLKNHSVPIYYNSTQLLTSYKQKVKDLF
jgi:hypothetical protein